MDVRIYFLIKIFDYKSVGHKVVGLCVMHCDFEGLAVGIDSCGVVGRILVKVGIFEGEIDWVGRGTSVIIVERVGREVGYDVGVEVGKFSIGGQVGIGS